MVPSQTNELKALSTANGKINFAYQLRQTLTPPSLGELIGELRERLQPALGFVEILTERARVSKNYRTERILLERLRSALYGLDYAVGNIADAALASASADYTCAETFQTDELIRELAPVLEHLCRRKNSKLLIKNKSPHTTLHADWRHVRSFVLNLVASLTERAAPNRLTIELVYSRKLSSGKRLALTFRVHKASPMRPGRNLSSPYGFLTHPKPDKVRPSQLSSLLACYHLAALNGQVEIKSSGRAGFSATARIPV